MSDGPSFELSGPPSAWMPTCPECQRPVEGIVVWDDYEGCAKVYEAHCHGEKDELRITTAELAPIPWRDVAAYLHTRVERWQPFGN